MAKSKQTRDTAKAMVSPLFAWSNAVLKGGEMMLDSMQAAAKQAWPRVAILPDMDAPPRKRSTRGKAKRSRRAKAKR